MKFKVLEYASSYEILNLEDHGIIAKFFMDNPNDNAKGLAHDYCDFLNDKYLDKEINKEWPLIDDKIKQKRIKYHIEQLNKLGFNDNLGWNEHGTGVE
jgi:hypothetical protein